MATKNPNNYPEFVSPNGKPIALSLTSGHTTCVGTIGNPGEPTPLHPNFHREAFLQGCVLAAANGVQTNFVQPNATTLSREEIIDRAISAMVDEVNADPARQVQLFTGDGRPDANQLTGRVGFPVRAAERDIAWDKYQVSNPGSSD